MKPKDKPTKKPVTYETEIEYVCPVRGKIKQKVKVRRFEAVDTSSINEILPSKSVAEELDRKYSGLVLSDDSLEDENIEEDN